MNRLYFGDNLKWLSDRSEAPQKGPRNGFVKALRGLTGKGLRYAKLIGGDGIQQAWQTA
jgi:hypothetical protein